MFKAELAILPQRLQNFLPIKVIKIAWTHVSAAPCDDARCWTLLSELDLANISHLNFP